MALQWSSRENSVPIVNKKVEMSLLPMWSPRTWEG